MRLVPNQKSKKITELFIKYMKKICPKTSKVEIKEHHGGEPVNVSTDTVAYKAAAAAFKKVWGKNPYQHSMEVAFQLYLCLKMNYMLTQS